MTLARTFFPETDFKFYLDAELDERSKRRAAEGVNENLAARESTRTTSIPPRVFLMIALGAKVINNSGMTPKETSDIIIEEIHRRVAVNQ